jgi:hypothetical protein
VDAETGMNVDVGGTDVSEGVTFGVVTGTPHPATNDIMDITPIITSINLVLSILASIVIKTRLSRPTPELSRAAKRRRLE